MVKSFLNLNIQDLLDFCLSKQIKSLYQGAKVVLSILTQEIFNIKLGATLMLHHLLSNRLVIMLLQVQMIAAGLCMILKMVSYLLKLKLNHLSKQFNSIQTG